MKHLFCRLPHPLPLVPLFAMETDYPCCCSLARSLASSVFRFIF